MEGLVNYSSEDTQDDYPYSKVAVRERGSGGSGSTSGRSALGTVVDGSAKELKRRHERSKSRSLERDASPYCKSREAGSERFKGNYNDEDKYKTDKRSEKFSRDHREKRDNREPRSYRDTSRDYDNGHKHDYKKHDDHKRYRDPKRDFKRDGDYYKDDKRYNRHEDRKPASNYNKERFSSSKPRYDRKPYDERSNDDRKLNDDRRSSGSNIDDRRRDLNDKRSYNDSKSDRRNNDDRRSKRSYNEDRSSSYRPRRSASPSPAAAASSSSSSRKYDKDDYPSKRDRKHHSRSRSPASRSSSVEKVNEREQTSHNSSQRASLGLGEHVVETRPETVTQVTQETKPKPTARNFEALLSLPLSETAAKHSNVVTVPPISTGTGLPATAAAVQLPSYYNPNVINPNKYVEQMQKRKLIWGAKKVEDSASKWGHAQFSQDQDGKVASKFMRLMGIKSGGGVDSSTSPNENEKKSPSSSTTSPSNSTDVKSREAMFTTMEHQYEVARQVTHTMRGVGLGFGSQPRPY